MTRSIAKLPFRQGQFVFATALIALLAILLSYQFRLPFSVDVGGPIDRPLLSRVNDPETDKLAGTRFRWTTGGTELKLLGWGAGNPTELKVRATRWRPNDGIADLTIYVNGLDFTDPPAAGQGWQEYALAITDPQYLQSDDLIVKFESDTFVPKATVAGADDPRRLGIQISSIRLTPLELRDGKWRPHDGLVWSPFRLPPLDLAIYFVASAVLLYIGLTTFRVARPIAFAVSSLIAGAAAVGLVLARPYVTLFAATFFESLVFAIALGLLSRALLPRFLASGRVQVNDWEVNLISLLFAFATLIKVDMLLYPQTISFDLLYHIHRLQAVLQGQLFWSFQSGKNEFAGLPVPYLPSYYLFLAPLAAFVPLNLLVQISGVLLDNLTIFFVYYILKKYFDDGLAGIFAALTFVFAPLGLIGLSWGIYANIFGQFLTMLLVVALLEGFSKLATPRVVFTVALLFALTLLSHTSVFASIVPLFAVWTALLFVLGRMWWDRRVWALVGSIVVASAVAFAIYYSDFLGLIGQGVMQIAAASVDTTTSNAPAQSPSFWELLQPARTEFTAVPLYVYAAAAIGFALLIYRGWRAPTERRFLALAMLGAWLIAFGLLIAVRAQFGFSSRYVNFAMPAIVICAGAALAWLYARGLPGRILSLGLCGLLAVQGLYHWFILVMYKYH